MQPAKFSRHGQLRFCWLPFLFGILCMAQQPSSAPIPVGLDAYRAWDRWDEQKIGMRAYMRSTYDRSGATKARTLPTLSISFPMISTLRSTLRAQAFSYSAATTIGMEAHGITWWTERTILFRKAVRPILCNPVLSPPFFLWLHSPLG